MTYSFINLFRALAAFWVLAAHCMIWGGWYGLPVPSAKIAVDLFMLVSGFLMAANTTHRWGVEPLDVPANRLRFWLRRFFRLAPAFYLSLAVIAIGAPLFLDGMGFLQSINRSRFPAGGIYDPTLIQYDWQNLLMHASFLSGVHPDYVLSAGLPDWSLSLEMQFYLAFPLLFLTLGRTRVALVVALVVLYFGRHVWSLGYFAEPSLLPFKLHYFIAGMLLFRAIASEGAKRVGAAAAAVLLVSLGIEYGQAIIVAPLLLLAMLAMGFMESSKQTPAWLARIVDSRVTLFASNASYAVYLFHGMFIATFGALLSVSPVLMSLNPALRVGVMFVFVCIGAYALAYAVHRWVELPGIQLGRHALALVPSERRPVPSLHAGAREE